MYVSSISAKHYSFTGAGTRVNDVNNAGAPSVLWVDGGGVWIVGNLDIPTLDAATARARGRDGCGMVTGEVEA